MSRDEVRIYACPDMPALVLDILAGGDLQKELPQWRAHFAKAWGELSGCSMNERRKRSWRAVLLAYDEATEPKVEDVT